MYIACYAYTCADTHTRAQTHAQTHITHVCMECRTEIDTCMHGVSNRNRQVTDQEALREDERMSEASNKRAVAVQEALHEQANVCVCMHVCIECFSSICMLCGGQMDIHHCVFSSLVYVHSSLTHTLWCSVIQLDTPTHVHTH